MQVGRLGVRNFAKSRSSQGQAPESRCFGPRSRPLRGIACNLESGLGRAFRGQEVVRLEVVEFRQSHVHVVGTGIGVDTRGLDHSQGPPVGALTLLVQARTTENAPQQHERTNQPTASVSMNRLQRFDFLLVEETGVVEFPLSRVQLRHRVPGPGQARPADVDHALHHITCFVDISPRLQDDSEESQNLGNLGIVGRET